MNNYKRWIAAAGPLALTCLVSAQGKLTSVTTHHTGEGLSLQIEGKNLSRPKVTWADGVMLLEFNADLFCKPATAKVKKGGIASYSFEKAGKGKVNIAVRPTESRQPSLEQGPAGWAVRFDSYPALVPQLNIPQKFAPVNPRDTFATTRVTLNFVNTDIVQILKALAMQGNVNIAIGPEVSGRITVNLDNLLVPEAMNIVTTLGNVRYALINNSFIVTSNGRFSDTMEQIHGRMDATSETRVVPLFSREGNQIKAAVLKTVPTTTGAGKYDLVLPSDKVDVQQVQNLTAKDDKGDKGATSTGTETSVQTKSSDTSEKKDDYIVLVGTPARLNQVEQTIRSIDGQICQALGIKVGSMQGNVQKVYQPKGLLAQDLLKALVGDGKSEFIGVQMVATPGKSSSQQAIVMSGRASDVDRVFAMISDLDTVPDAADTQYEMVGLKFIKPNFAKVQVLQAVPGMQASFLPPPVDPKVGINYTEEAGGSGNSGEGGSQGAAATTPPAAGGGTQGSSGQQMGGASTSSTVSTSTLSNSVPMKLLLRGTREQIAQAKQYLEMVDIAPKQVAIELRVMELTRNEALQVGLDWSILTGGTLSNIRINQGLGTDSTAGGVKAGFRFPGGGTASILGALDAISTKNNVLARPSILVNDGSPTNIFIGDEVRYIKSITSSQNGPSVITDEIDVGVDFNVVARVGEDGNIALDLSPVLKVLQGFTPVPGGGSLPQTSRRSANSQVSIRSGETIAIGGLIQDQDRRTEAGIPILKDLPIIGRLFRRTDNQKIRSEVVFFVTVKEVTQGDRQTAADPRNGDKKKGG